MKWNEFNRKVKLLLGRFFTFEFDDDRIIYFVGKKEYTFTRSEYEKMVNQLDSCYSSNYSIYNDKHYEVMVDQTDKISRRIPPRVISPATTKKFNLYDKRNKIDYKFQSISDLMILNLLKSENLNELRRFISSNFKSYMDNKDFKLFNLLRVSIRSFYSIYVTYENKIGWDKIVKYVDAFLFNLCLSYGFSFRILDADDDSFHRGYRFKLRTNKTKDLEAPKLIYKKDLTEQYHMAVSSSDPFIQFIGFYHIMEYFFEEVYKEDIIKTTKEILMRPDFSPKNSKDIMKVVDNIYNKKDDSIVGAELDSLEITLGKYINIERIVDKLNEIDEVLVQYYKNCEVGFSGGMKVDLEVNNKKIFKHLSKRIYVTRNSLVHSKSNDIRVKERGIYSPFKDSKDLNMEIPLLKVIAEEIIIGSAKEL